MVIKVRSRWRLLVLTLGLALLVLTVPAQATHNPTFVGGNTTCADAPVNEPGLSVLTLTDPITAGPHTAGGVVFNLTNITRKTFSFTTTGAVYDVIVKGSASNWYDYDDDVPNGSPVNAGTNLQIPNGNKLNLIHFCYGANPVPVANPDSYSATEDTVLTVATPGVLSNDTDNTAITAVQPSTPSHGTVILNPNGSFSYTPTANYNGLDSFTYKASDGQSESTAATVSITVAAVNDPSVAADDAANVAAGGSVLINVLDNDTDIDGALTVTSTTDPLSGSVEIVGGTQVRYTPDGSFEGPTDSFTYTVNGESTATVTVTVFAGDITCDQVPENPDGGPFVTKRGVDTDEGCKGASGELLFTYDQGVIDGGAFDGLRFVDFVASNPNPLAGDGQARFIETITWDVDKPAPGADQFGPLYYDDHVGDGYQLMPWCATDLWDDGTGLPVFPAIGSSPLPGDHTSCLIHSETFVSGTRLTSIDYVYNEGDGGRAR